MSISLNGVIVTTAARRRKLSPFDLVRFNKKITVGYAKIENYTLFFFVANRSRREPIPAVVL